MNTVIGDCIDMINEMLIIIPDTPFMYLFGLAIVLIIIRNIFDWLNV